MSWQLFLAPQDAPEVMYVSQWVTPLFRDFAGVTLVNDDTYWRLDWCDSGEEYDEDEEDDDDDDEDDNDDVDDDDKHNQKLSRDESLI